MKSSRGKLFSSAVALALVTGPGADSTRSRLPGYGGVLPVPLTTEEISSALSALEILDRPSDKRELRGRVLYANDRAPRAGEPARPPAEKRPCPQSLTPSRTSATPNS